ncbi:MAG: RNase H-like domain-containing protein, partial [Sedimenticola sp.]
MVTVKDRFPLPNISDCLDTLQGTSLFSTLDMAMGYYQIKIHPDSQHKTAFITKYCQFSHVRLGFGLCNAPATFQRAIQLVLRGLLWEEVLAYLDDIIVLGRDFNNALANLQKVLDRFRHHNLKLKPTKCKLLREQVEFLGKIVTKNGISISPSKIDAVTSWPIPNTQKELQSFLGFVNYHRDHVEHFAEIAAPLYELSTTKGHIQLSDEHLTAFQTLKTRVTSAPCLSFPIPGGMFVIDVDASDRTIGGELSQFQNGTLKPICFASNTLLKTQLNYCTTRKELLSVVKFCRHFRHYLLGQRFLIRTDHNSLVWLTRFKDLQGQLARWVEELSQYDMEILHRDGKKHINCDALSRIPDPIKPCDCYNAGSSLESLPCGGCDYCTRAHNQWSHFSEDVDDVVPLAVRTVTAQTVTPSPNSVSSSNSTPNPDSDSDDPSLDPGIPSTSETSVPNWLQTFSPDQLRSIQLEDPNIAPVINWLETDTEPSLRQLRLTHPSTRAYWLCRAHLHFINGVLYYQWEEGGSRSARHSLFLVPEGLRNQVLFLCHDVKHAGHLGIQKTVTRLKNSFYWYGMSRDGREYVKSCSKCNKSKKSSNTPRAPMRAFHAGFPMERVHMDILGPFNTSSSGNKYILMIICQFTKWIDMIPISDQTAENFSHIIIVSYFGCPLEIFTDQGSNFQSNLFSAFCELLEITRARTTPYRPSGNG